MFDTSILVALAKCVIVIFSVPILIVAMLAILYCVAVLWLMFLAVVLDKTNPFTNNHL